MRNTLKTKHAVMLRPVKSQRGFTLLEMVVVIIVISVIGFVALSYYQKLLVDSERTRLQHDVGVMRSAIGMQVADYIVSGELHRLGELAGSNPIDLLEEKPDNYLGIFPDDRSAELERGNWFFAEDEVSLIYIVRNEVYCETALNSPKRIKFKISPRVDDKGKAGTRIVGLTLKETAPYRWLSPWD
jgi:general secretion pathway protein G